MAHAHSLPCSQRKWRLQISVTPPGPVVPVQMFHRSPVLASYLTWREEVRLGRVQLPYPGLTWPGDDLPDSTRQSKLAAAKRKLKEFQQRSCPGSATRIKNKRKAESDPETRGNQETPQKIIQKELASDLNHFHGDLRPSLGKRKVHTQTTGVLVSPKSELQPALTHAQKDAGQKSGKAKDLATQLHLSQQRIAELENALSTHLQKQSEPLQQLQAEQDQLRHSQTAPKLLDGEATAPAEPTEVQQQIEKQLAELQQEKEVLCRQYETQAWDNQQLICLNRELEERLQELEATLQHRAEEVVDRKQHQETLRSYRATISQCLSQNRALKERLAELQDGFVKLTNDKVDLRTALDTEKHVKEQMSKKLVQVEEKLKEADTKARTRGQEAQRLLEERNQIYIHLQQYLFAFSQVAREKQQLQKESFAQMLLMDHLQHQIVQGRETAEQHQRDLQQAQENLEAAAKKNRELMSYVGHLLSSSGSTYLSSNLI